MHDKTHTEKNMLTGTNWREGSIVCWSVRTGRWDQQLDRLCDGQISRLESVLSCEKVLYRTTSLLHHLYKTVLPRRRSSPTSPPTYFRSKPIISFCAEVFDSRKCLLPPHTSHQKPHHEHLFVFYHTSDSKAVSSAFFKKVLFIVILQLLVVKPMFKDGGHCLAQSVFWEERERGFRNRINPIY